MKNTLDTSTVYNVYCMNCDQVLLAHHPSPLWWKAKKKADSGKLDALLVNNCGCQEKNIEPSSPFRVCWIDFDGCNEAPCSTWMETVKLFRQVERRGEMPIAKGLSEKVIQAIQFGKN